MKFAMGVHSTPWSCAERFSIDSLTTNDVRSPFYYRIHGPRLIIEFAVQEPNHVHTIMRDPQNDYGTDWLGRHYEEHAWTPR